MSHHHLHTERNLWIAVAGNFFLAAVEAIYGIWSGSIVLVFEAGHNGVDVLTLVLSALTTRWVQREPRPVNGRVSAFVGLVNVLTLDFWILYTILEAVHRLYAPKHVESSPLLVIGAVSLVLNLWMGWFLYAKHHDLHVRTVSLHLLSDAAGTVGFFAAGILIRVTGASVWDPTISILLALGVALTSVPLTRACVQEVRRVSPTL